MKTTDFNYKSLKNKVILVTGATSGIGKAVSEQLLNQDAKVFGIGRDITKIDKSLKKNKNFTLISFDLYEINEIENLLNNLVDKNAKFDGFVNCAGREETIPLNLYKSDKIKSLYNLNVFSSIELLRVFSKKKISNNFSSIVFISSVMGELGMPGKVGYCSSKSAILGVVKSSSLELSKRRIRVNAVSPGIVLTPLTEKLFLKISDENISAIKDMHPLGFGKTEDVAPLILFLLSAQSKWVTGQNIKVDGGYSVK